MHGLLWGSAGAASHTNTARLRSGLPLPGTGEGRIYAEWNKFVLKVKNIAHALN